MMAPSHKPEVIIFDLRIVDLHILSAIEMLKGSPTTGQTKIIVLGPGPELSQQVRENTDRHFALPVDLAELKNAICDVLDIEQEPERF